MGSQGIGCVRGTRAAGLCGSSTTHTRRLGTRFKLFSGNKEGQMFFEEGMDF